ncbi:MAG: glycerophosphodiester phosphodiesterase family protein [Pseudomonadota bacterium]
MSGKPNCTDPGLVIAHRGASEFAPENTLAAFRLAAEQGTRWIEFDVSLLGDGTPVVIHDATLNRCSDWTGPLSELSVYDLSGIDAGSWKHPDFTGEPLPTLEAALQEIEALGLYANLELKPHDGETGALAAAVAPVLASLDWTDERIITSSFVLPELAAFRTAMPSAPVAVLYNDPPDTWHRDLCELNAAAMHMNWRFLRQSLLTDVTTRGFDLRVFTINDPEVVEPFRDHGLTSVITDHPPLYLERPDWQVWISR